MILSSGGSLRTDPSDTRDLQRNYDGDPQREGLKQNRFTKQNNSSRRASQFLANFFAVPAQLHREMSKFEVDLRTGTARR